MRWSRFFNNKKEWKEETQKHAEKSFNNMDIYKKKSNTLQIFNNSFKYENKLKTLWNSWWKTLSEYLFCIVEIYVETDERQIRKYLLQNNIIVQIFTNWNHQVLILRLHSLLSWAFYMTLHLKISCSLLILSGNR